MYKKITKKKNIIVLLRCFLAALGLSLCFASPAMALDKIVLKDEEVIEGVIISYTDDEIAIKTKQDNIILYINRNDIAYIIPAEPISFTSAQKLFEEKNYAQSIVLYRAVIKENSDPYWKQRALLQIGLAYIELDKQDQAEETFRSFLSSYLHSPMLAKANFYLARILVKQKRHKEAVVFYENVIKQEGIKEFQAEAQYDLAEIYFGQEEYETALMGYLRVMIIFYKKDKIVPKAMLKAGLCYEKLELKELARETYEDIITSYPQTEHINPANERLEALMQEENL